MEQSKYLINFLRLTFPPFPLYDVDLFVKNTKAHKLISESNLYMLCRKKFTQLHLTHKINNKLYIDMFIEEIKVSSGYIDISQYGNSLVIKTFENQCAIEIYNQETEALIERFDSENILWQKSIKHQNIYGFNNFRDLMKYELLYVGISAKDSYNRLVEQVHHAQTKIMRNESPKTKGNGIGVADEVFILCFTIDTITLKDTMMPELDLKDDIIQDSEKVFIQAFQPKYNEVRFNNYFKNNSLKNLGFKGLCYYLGVDISIFNSEKIMNGNNTVLFNGKEPDCIIVNFDEECIELLPT